MAQTTSFCPFCSLLGVGASMTVRSHPRRHIGAHGLDFSLSVMVISSSLAAFSPCWVQSWCTFPSYSRCLFVVWNWSWLVCRFGIAPCPVDTDRVMATGRKTVGSWSSLELCRFCPCLLGCGLCRDSIGLIANRRGFVVGEGSATPRAFASALASKWPKGHGALAAQNDVI